MKIAASLFKNLRPTLIDLLLLVLSLNLALATVFAADLSTATNSASAVGQNNQIVADASGRYVSDELVIKFKEPASDVQKALILEERGLEVKRDDAALGAVLVKINPNSRDQVKEALKNNPNIEYVGLNGIAKGTSKVPNDPNFSQQWNLNKIKAPEGWETSSGRKEVTVAVLDTGINYNHPDIGLYPGGRVLNGWDFINNDNDSMDDNGHGTWVTGILGAKENNSQDIAGVDWSAKLLAVKIGDSNNSSSNFIMAQGIQWAVDNYPYLKVINISFVGLADDLILKGAVSYAIARGVLIVASTVNGDNPDCFMGLPAAYDGVIAVVGTDSGDNWTTGCTGNVLVDPFGGGQTTTFKDYIQVAAPGRDVLTLNISGGVPEPMWGTSAAAPHVAGIASILASCADIETIKLALELGSDDLGSAGPDSTYGYGRVNMFKAMQVASCNKADVESDSDNDSYGLLRTQNNGFCKTNGQKSFFNNCIENYVRGQSANSCAQTAGTDDEISDAEATDVNDDRRINLTDRSKMVLAIKNASGGNYNQRYDLNADGQINITDRSIWAMAARAGRTSGMASCTPNSTRITASDNPCVVERGATSCKTWLFWQADTGSNPWVCVKSGSDPEVFYGTAPVGQEQAAQATIYKGTSYTFTLYSNFCGSQPLGWVTVLGF
ncbi:MAG: hypothetical protein A2629_01865 [Candidatus Levybacteria bacterium RIFCSPHIGHO2_01_FULL_41_15]|nr:MAG: hypothetical protein A2629_01865 [Candidatus Levybacteria bacterium RIFCSPHIGHO2_01_FULL_41_15]